MPRRSLYEAVKLNRTLEVVIENWQKAEQRLQLDIRESVPGLGEEFITQLFGKHLADTLREASNAHQIEQAFEFDLAIALGGSSYETVGISEGLVAQLTLHKRKTEGITGGDFGLVISQPRINLRNYELLFAQKKRGLLSQAKLKKAPPGSATGWGLLTKPQQKALPPHLGYLGLALYSYQDPARRHLAPFSWQICKTARSIRDINAWLKSGKFPSQMDSSTLIRRLGNGTIGTMDKKIIEDFIIPAGNLSFELTINWPDDAHPPGSHVTIYSPHESRIQKEEPRMHIHLGS